MWERKLNFGNLRLYNKRHLNEHKQNRRQQGMKKEYIHNYNVRDVSIEQIGTYEKIPEKVAEIGMDIRNFFQRVLPNLY